MGLPLGGGPIMSLERDTSLSEGRSVFLDAGRESDSENERCLTLCAGRLPRELKRRTATSRSA